MKLVEKVARAMYERSRDEAFFDFLVPTFDELDDEEKDELMPIAQVAIKAVLEDMREKAHMIGAAFNKEIGFKVEAEDVGEQELADIMERYISAGVWLEMLSEYEKSIQKAAQQSTQAGTGKVDLSSTN